MLIKIIPLMSTLHSSNLNFEYYETNENSITQEINLIKLFIKDIKIILGEINNSIEEEIKLFTETFKNIVEDHRIGLNNADKWPPLTSTVGVHKNYFIPFDAAPDSTFQIRLSILKKLFFNDLLFYYYDFCYRTRKKFSEMYDNCEFMLGQVSMLLTELRDVKKISYDEIGLGSVEELICEDFNIYDFFKELKNIVCESLEMGKYEIYDFLHTGLEVCDVYDRKKCFETYETINYFIMSYKTSMNDDKKFSLQYQNPIFYRTRKNSFIDFENYFLNCLTLNITGEFEKRSRSPKDKRFETYRDSIKIINECNICNKYCKDMLKNLPCNIHQNILNQIRDEFFRFMDNS